MARLYNEQLVRVGGVRVAASAPAEVEARRGEVMLLALDLGMRCGWSLWTMRGEFTRPAGGYLASGVWHIAAEHTFGRFGHFRLLVGARITSQGVTRIAYEHVHHHAGNDASHVYGGWLAALDEVACTTGAVLVPITTSEIHAVAGVTRARSAKVAGQSEAEARKASQARRALNKAATVAAAKSRGWMVKDDNEAEACFCGLAALTKAGAV